MNIKLNGWNWTGIVGLLRTLQEFLLPDPLPEFINMHIAQNALHPAIGLDSVLKAFLIFWIWWGLACFLIGLVGSVKVAFRS